MGDELMTNNWPLQSDAARFYGVVGSIPAQLANVPSRFRYSLARITFVRAKFIKSARYHLLACLAALRKPMIAAQIQVMQRARRCSATAFRNTMEHTPYAIKLAVLLYRCTLTAARLTLTQRTIRAASKGDLKLIAP